MYDENYTTHKAVPRKLAEGAGRMTSPKGGGAGARFGGGDFLCRPGGGLLVGGVGVSLSWVSSPWVLGVWRGGPQGGPACAFVRPGRGSREPTGAPLSSALAWRRTLRTPMAAWVTARQVSARCARPRPLGPPPTWPRRSAA